MRSTGSILELMSLVVSVRISSQKMLQSFRKGSTLQVCEPTSVNWRVDKDDIKRCIFSLQSAASVTFSFLLGVSKHYIGPVGQPTGSITLSAGTTLALSATRRGPDPNRPTKRAFFENWD